MINCTIVYKTSAENLVLLYKSLVPPHLEYCTAAWSPHYVRDKKKIQRRFTRMIPELKTYNMKTDSENLTYGRWKTEECVLI